MKKISALILALSMLLAFAACGDEPVVQEPVQVNPVQQYFDENGEAFLSSMVDSFASSSDGLTCKGDLKVEGSAVIVGILIDGLNDVTDDMKTQLQEIYAKDTASFDAILALMQTAVPELESIVFNICEEDGDVLASLKVGK